MRKKLILELVSDWRQAENHFLDTHDDVKKWEVWDKQMKVKLTAKETQELYDLMEI